MSLIFWYLTFLNVLSKTSKVSENSVASGSESLDMKESIWSGTLFKLLSRPTCFSAMGVFAIVRIAGWESAISVLSSIK